MALKFAQVEDNLITNFAVYEDGETPPEGWIDVTGIFCDIGYPVVAGVPVERPSKFYTVNAAHDGWELTTEGDDKRKADNNGRVKNELSTIDVETVRCIREFLLLKFDGDPDLPVYLQQHEDAAEAKRAELE